ncbi:Ig-like domain-containing protein, partial [Verminephrobacter aporrectodeae]
YADPTTGNDTNAIQDAAGNDAASFAATAVTNNTPAPADTTPPVINTATVTGDQLVLTYTEANTLDAAALAGNAGFTVNTAAGTAAITVSSALVNATAKTVTLTLSRAVTNTETVTVSYTKPASGAVVQDAAGNDAVNFSERAVTNSTPAPPDTQPPTLAATDPITIGDNKLARDESTTVTIRFSEAIAASSFSLADLTAEGSGVTLSNLQTTDGGTTWTVTLVAPTFDDYVQGSVTSSTNNKIRVNLAGITDLAGNAGVGTEASTVSYDIDLQDPIATITLADSTLTVGETTTVTFRFNEVVTNFDASKIELSNANGTLGPLTAGADGKTWTATFTPTANTNGGADNTIGVKGGVTDVAGNSDARIFTSAKYSVDTRSGGNTTGPTATITLADTALTAGETTTVTFRFSEAVSGFAADDVVLTDANGTLGPLTADADGRTWTATFTPTANVNDATNAIRVNLTGVTNTGGYAGVGSASSANYTVNTGAQDTTPPVLDTATVRGNQLVLRFNDANQLDATLENKPTNEAFTVRVGSAANAVTAVAVDAQAKTVTLTLSTPVAHGQSVTVAYSDPTANDDVRAIQDAVGNDVASFAATAVRNDTPADTTGPTLAATNPITIGDDKLHLGEGTTVIIRFSEDIDASSFSIDDLTVGGGATLSNLRSTGGGTTTWEVTLTAPGILERILNPASVNSSTGNKIRVNLAQITDLAGNAGAGTAVSTVSYDIDVVPPGVSITLADNDLTSGATTVVSFSFTEVVSGFDASKIDLSNANGTLGPLTASEDGKTWTATFTPTENVNDVRTNTIRVNMSGVRDLAGNGTVSPVSSAHYTVDTRSAGGVVVPTATITLANTTLKAGETTTVTFRFSETVSGFSSEDIVLTDANGTLGPLTAVGTDRKIWTATFTPTATVEDASNSIGVNMTGVRNAAERAGVGITHSANYSIDTKRPTLAATHPITLRDDKLHLGESTTATIRFSEDIAPDSFSIADLSVEGGARLSNLRRTDGGTTWEVTLKAPESASVSSTTGNKISVNLAGITDLAGNAGVGTADSTVRYDIDAVLPSVTITLADSSLTVGETTIVTFSFNEAVNGFDASKIDLSNANGTLGPLIASADGKTWTATFTPSANVADTSNTIGVNMSGVRDQAGNSATGTITSANYTVDTRSDTTAPALIITGDSRPKITGNQLVLSFSDTGNLDADATHTPANSAFTVLVNGVANAVTNVTVGAQAKTVTLTLTTAVTSDQSVTVAYTDPTTGNDANAIQDAAGNDAPSFAATEVTNNTSASADTTPPQLIITGDSRPKITGNQLVLSFSDTGNLDADATHTPANSAFTVL